MPSSQCQAINCRGVHKGERCQFLCKLGNIYCGNHTVKYGWMCECKDGMVGSKHSSLRAFDYQSETGKWIPRYVCCRCGRHASQLVD